MNKKLIVLAAMILSITVQTTITTERPCHELLALKEYYKGHKKEPITQQRFLCLKCKNDVATFTKAIEYAKKTRIHFLKLGLEVRHHGATKKKKNTDWGDVVVALEHKAAQLEQQQEASSKKPDANNSNPTAAAPKK